MAKWKLLLSTLPFVIVVIIVKILVSKVFQFEGIIEFSDIAMVLTGGIFLIGFMLAGTMSDFKESEKIPGELSSHFETLEDTIEHSILVNKTPIDRIYFMAAHKNLVHSIMDWLLKKKTQEEVYDSINSLVIKIREFEKAGVSGSAAGKIIGDINNIRKVVTRIGVISRTGFLATGYALLEMLIGCIIFLLMIAKFKSITAELIIITFVTLIYTYMYRLIKDIDDPFEYGPEGERGVSEIPLFPMREYMERLDKRK